MQNNDMTERNVRLKIEASVVGLKREVASMISVRPKKRPMLTTLAPVLGSVFKMKRGTTKSL